MSEKPNHFDSNDKENGPYIPRGLAHLGQHLTSEDVDDAMFILVDGNIVFNNKKSEELTGYSTQELCQKSFINHVHEDDKNEVLEKLGDPSECSRIFRIINKNKEALRCHAGIVPICWDEKSGILLALKDLTPQKDLEDQLQQAQKMEALGTLVAGVAHEINNPVNLIMYNMPVMKKIWADLLPLVEKNAKEEPARKYGGLTSDYLQENLHQLLSDIDLAANRIAKIVEDLKNFSKQSDVTQKETMNVNSAVENALRLAKSTLKKSRIEVEMDLAKNLPDIEGNRHSIGQVLLNIILNAFQAIDHDHGKIAIKSAYEIKSGKVLISIADNGPGIDPSIGNKILDPFVTNKQSQGGTGLGLAVSYNLVKAHGGEISFRNREKEGAVFSIHLPVKSIEKKYKVLIADDDEIIREIIVKILQREDKYLMDEAINGIEACIKLGTYKPDLLILDIMMPEMDGAEVCRTITRNDDFKDLKVLITTGHPEHPKVAEVNGLGFSNVMGKPFNLKKFSTEVDKILTS